LAKKRDSETADDAYTADEPASRFRRQVKRL